jgi:hypothetical protein
VATRDQAFAIIRYPMPPIGPLALQLKFGRTSAPFWPQAWQVNSGSISGRRMLSDHRSALIAIETRYLGHRRATFE